jgi:hypothetical protein
MAAWRAFSFSVPGPAAIAAAAATAAAEGVEDALAITRVLLCQPVMPALLSAVEMCGGANNFNMVRIAQKFDFDKIGI